MSNDLRKACEVFLRSTYILKHNYGVPSFDLLTYRDPDVLSIEERYYILHKELIAVLSELIYLKKIEELSTSSKEETDIQFEEARKDLSLIESSSLGKFLRVQNEVFKNTHVIDNYSKIILPTLKSIHHSNLTVTEIQILDDLKHLHDSENGRILELIAQSKSHKEREKTLANISNDISSLLKDEIKPKVVQLSKISDVINRKQKNLIQRRHVEVSNILSTIDSKRLESYSSGVGDLVNKWETLGILCDLLPALITSLPLNWFNDQSLSNVVNDCSKLSERLNKYQMVINSQNIDDLTLRDLLLLNFDELKF